jgi:glutathione reductase (NADPH)
MASGRIAGRIGMLRNFEVVLIGTGSAASVGTLRTREAGGHVAIVKPGPLGGTCAPQSFRPY